MPISVGEGSPFPDSSKPDHCGKLTGPPPADRTGGASPAWRFVQ